MSESEQANNCSETVDDAMLSMTDGTRAIWTMLQHTLNGILDKDVEEGNLSDVEDGFDFKSPIQYEVSVLISLLKLNFLLISIVIN